MILSESEIMFEYISVKRLLNVLAAAIICTYSPFMYGQSDILLNQSGVPMKEETDESAYTRWLKKEVLDSLAISARVENCNSTDFPL